MPRGTISAEIPASADEVFTLLHDYDRRLEWDTLLQEAYLTEGHTEAKLGATTVCRGRSWMGSIAMKTIYVSFRPPEVAAVKLINRVPFFEKFAASIRHRVISENSSSLEYTYNFQARPRWLRFVLHPIMSRFLKWETAKRLDALRRVFER